MSTKQEPLDPPVRSIKEDDIIFNHIEPVISELGDKELKAIIGDNVETSESVKPSESAVVDLLESSNCSSSKYIEITNEHPREINGDEGSGVPSKATEGNENSDHEVKIQESQEANVNDVTDQPKTTDATDYSEVIKAVEGESRTWTPHEAAFDLNQTELMGDSSNLVIYQEMKVNNIFTHTTTRDTYVYVW